MRKQVYTFVCEYRTTDGSRWVSQISAQSWSDAISQAEFLGVVITGVLVAEYPLDSMIPIKEYSGEQCPPCPIVFRNHPNIQ